MYAQTGFTEKYLQSSTVIEHEDSQLKQQFDFSSTSGRGAVMMFSCPTRLSGNVMFPRLGK